MEPTATLLNRLLELSPLGAQTFSKSHRQFPEKNSPHFLQKGKGCMVWDTAENKYTDFISGLLTISLGYADDDINQAVISQINNGVSFSLPHPIEIELAEKITSLIPCADMVRFAKNGSDVTTAAIRLARAYTQREHIALCGYHGWHDWSIGTTSKDAGVPDAVKLLSHAFQYNDIDSLKHIFRAHPKKIAAVILEPMNHTFPDKHFLQEVQACAEQEGALLIFDEVVTGFRFSVGGAQQYFNVTPDLACFGKGMANGFPCSALVGRRDVMTLLNDTFISSTFGGETLSMVAASATLDKIVQHQVPDHLAMIGRQLMEQTTDLIKQHQLESVIDISGHPAWSFLHFHDIDNCSSWDIKTFYIQELLARGILCTGTHNLSYSHQQEHVAQLIASYDEIFSAIRQHINTGCLQQHLVGPPIQPIFQVR